MLQRRRNIDYINEGDTVEDMMRYVHIDMDLIRQNYKELVTAKVPAQEQQSVLEELEQGLMGYTYFEDFLMNDSFTKPDYSYSNAMTFMRAVHWCKTLLITMLMWLC